MGTKIIIGGEELDIPAIELEKLKAKYKPARTFRRGQVVELGTSKSAPFLIVCFTTAGLFGSTQACLVSVSDGLYWETPVTVANPLAITEDEMNQALGTLKVTSIQKTWENLDAYYTYKGVHE